MKKRHVDSRKHERRREKDRAKERQRECETKRKRQGTEEESSKAKRARGNECEIKKKFLLKNICREWERDGDCGSEGWKDKRIHMKQKLKGEGEK